MKVEKCMNCKFWGSNHSMGVDREMNWEVNRCQRHAPQPYHADETVPNNATDFALWPVTDMSDWCGEYQAGDPKA